MKFQLTIFILYVCASNIKNVQGSKILFLYPMTTTSETHIFLPLAKNLAEKGHAVTIVTPVKSENLSKNIHQVVATKPLKDIDFFVTSNVIDERKLTKDRFTYMLSFDAEIFNKHCHTVYKDEEFKKLLTQKFDLIFINAWANDCLEGLVYKFQVPYIVLSSMPAIHATVARTGFHVPPSFIPIPLFEFTSRMSFSERFVNTLMVWLVAAMEPSTKLGAEEVYRQYLGQDVPRISKIEKNLSLIMSNSHPLLNFPRPALPDTIEIGGIHCRDPKPLPKDLNDFMNSAEHGVIFFSLGSVVQTKTLPDHIRKIFLSVFSKLKQKVLFKWDTEEMSDLPPNVKLAKWAPQQDILGHPKVKLFISHGGLLSTEESTYHGVPMLGLPIFVDQDVNIKQAEELGFALMEEILDITEESFGGKLNRMLTEPSFTTKAKEMSRIFKDQPESPLERATFWVEYVLRHKGAPHLKSPARDLNFFQYHSVDVIGLIALILLSTIGGFVWIVRRLCCSSKKSNSDGRISNGKKKN